MCGKTATWCKEKHIDNEGIYFCDDCVPRNSIDNIRNIEDWGEPDSNAHIMWWNENSRKNDLLKNGSLTRTSNSFYYEYLNDKLQRGTSTHFKHSAEGFPLSLKKEKVLNQIEILNAYTNNKKYLSTLEIKKVGTSIAEVLMDKSTLDMKQTIPYNLFMSKFGDKIKTSCLALGYKSGLKRFYHHFKKDLS